MFKNKGLLRNDMEFHLDNPSFFSISMGVGLGGKDIGFNLLTDLQDAEQHGITPELISYFANSPEANVNIDFRSATVVDAEGAYFFNKYVGVGGRFRVRAMSAKSFGNYADISSEDGIGAWTYDINEIYENATTPRTLTPATINNGGSPVSTLEGIVKSDHLAEFSGSVGLYFNLPLSKRFALGAKALIGRSFTQKLDIDGYAKGNIMDIDYSLTVKNGDLVDHTIQMPQKTSNTYEVEWDYVTLGADNTTTWGTGLSLTYKYKSNFSWRIFADYDYSEKTFTLTYDPYHFIQYGLTGSAYTLAELTEIGPELYPLEYKKSKKMNYVTLGLSFLVNI
jgi:hypothetical protein